MMALLMNLIRGNNWQPQLHFYFCTFNANNMSKKYAFIIALLVIGIASRFIPHYPNFTAIGSMALLAGGMLRKPHLALALPILALFVSDLIINNVMYPGATFTLFYKGALYIYAAIVLSVLLARLVRRLNVKNYIALSILSSILFFMITNFGVLAERYVISPNHGWLDGLLRCGTSLCAESFAGHGILWRSDNGSVQRAYPAAKPRISASVISFWERDHWFSNIDFTIIGGGFTGHFTHLRFAKRIHTLTYS
jgi:hypothetical protein